MIANRGEIAVRVLKSAKAMGIKTVAIYSEADSNALHVRCSDESHCLGKADLSESYLNIGKIIDVAKKYKAEAIHPGYGFLSENPLFVKACDDSGIVFIGPNIHAMDIMGNKIKARNFVKGFKVPMTMSVEGDIPSLIAHHSSVPFPVLIKAAAGGGGKGMRIVYNEKELKNAVEATSREAKSYFGDGTVYIEQFIENPRHIEVQIIGDNYGNVIHLFERECSIQRRYQKIIEESPSVTLNDAVRTKMCETAVLIGKKVGYNNAGTIEFLVDEKLNYYFLEMNTRVQVEHPTTEMVTGVDIVKEQILIAAGNPLSINQKEIKQNGHAIECRIYAEDPENDFLPSPGKMTCYKEPEGEGIRIDTGIKEAVRIESFYDPMISKLIVWGTDRENARIKMINALKDYVVHGVKTDISYLAKLLEHKAYITNSISTKFCEEHKDEMLSICEKAKQDTPFYIPLLSYLICSLNNENILRPQTSVYNVWSSIGYWRDLMKIDMVLEGKPYAVFINKKTLNHFEFQIEGKKYTVLLSSGSRFPALNMNINGDDFTTYISSDAKGKGYISYEGNIFEATRNDILINEDIFSDITHSTGKDSNHILSPIPGKVIKINVSVGDKVKKGENLIVVEAMKMENHLISHKDATINKINVNVGDMVDNQAQLIELED